MEARAGKDPAPIARAQDGRRCAPPILRRLVAQRREGKSPAHFGRGRQLPIKLDADAGTRPSDLDPRLSYATALLDNHIAVTRTPADRDVAIAVHAVSVTQRSDAVFPAQPLSTRRQRKHGRPRHGDGDGNKMSCSHPLASIVLPSIKRVADDGVPQVRRLEPPPRPPGATGSPSNRPRVRRRNRPEWDGHHISRRGVWACCSPSAGGFRKNKRERVMIETVAFAVVSLALGIPALIGATMLGSKLNLD